MKNKFLLKVARKLILLLRYSPFNFSLKIRNFLYKFLFKKMGLNCNITEGVIISHPENISFGNRVSIHQYSILDAQGEIIVEDDVAIGSHCLLITSTHRFEDKNKKIKDQGISTKKIKISSNVWLGSRVTILQGVTIGKNYIIGAGSIVNKNIPDNVVAAGVPCKVLKNR